MKENLLTRLFGKREPKQFDSDRVANAKELVGQALEISRHTKGSNPFVEMNLNVAIGYLDVALKGEGGAL